MREVGEDDDEALGAFFDSNLRLGDFGACSWDFRQPLGAELGCHLRGRDEWRERDINRVWSLMKHVGLYFTCPSFISSPHSLIKLMGHDKLNWALGISLVFGLHPFPYLFFLYFSKQFS